MDFDTILKRMLDKVPANLDKRVGSIIYDALAPSAGELAQLYIELQIWKDQTYVLTAVGGDLDRKGEEYGVYRLQPTQSQRIGELIDTKDNLINIPINSRFTVPESNNTITYYVDRYIETGKPVLICEQLGTTGNEYVGELLPLFNIDNLKSSKIVSTLQPAQDKEDDEPYRARIIKRMNEKGFGGNIQDYKDYFIEHISGASEPKIYPVWNGGGTVKASVLDSEYNPITDEFKSEIKNIIDPEQYTGQGVGIAPIGHKVTIDTPKTIKVDITATVTLDGVTVGQIQTAINEYLEEYFLSTRKEWIKYETIRIFVSRVIEAILKVQGIQNVTNVTLNGQENDLTFTSTAQEQFIPVLGTVTLSE